MIGRLYLSMDTLPDGRVLAVVSDGSPQCGDKRVLVCTVKTFKLPMKAAEPLARAWFEKMCVERPWETRHNDPLGARQTAALKATFTTRLSGL